MTGWRCGWSLGPARGDRRAGGAAESCDVQRVVDHAKGGRGRADRVAGHGRRRCCEEYRVRRDAVHGWLTADRRITCVKPAGAFYLFPDLRDVLAATGFASTSEFAEALLDEARVAVTPGEAFDAPGFIRLSYATSMALLREGQPRACSRSSSAA